MNAFVDSGERYIQHNVFDGICYLDFCLPFNENIIAMNFVCAAIGIFCYSCEENGIPAGV